MYLLKFQTQMKNKEWVLEKTSEEGTDCGTKQIHLTLPLTSCEHRYITLLLCASVSLSTQDSNSI